MSRGDCIGKRNTQKVNQCYRSCDQCYGHVINAPGHVIHETGHVINAPGHVIHETGHVTLMCGKLASALALSWSGLAPNSNRTLATSFLHREKKRNFYH